MSKLNTIFKYADDTTLLVPEHTVVSICDEFEHVNAWHLNKLVLNFFKTKEIVFKRPRALHFHMPPAVDETEQLHWCIVSR